MAFLFWKKDKEDDGKLVRDIDDMFSLDLDPSRRIMEKIWFRNILYYIGEQYIEWVSSMATFRRRTLNSKIPTPVTNIIRDHVRSVKAMVLNKDFSIRVWPHSAESADREAAVLAQDLLAHMDMANDGAFKDEKEKIAIYLALFGTAFMRTYPDMDAGLWAFDKNGEFIPSGDVGDEAVLPFNVRLDALGARLAQKRWVGIKSLKPKEWVEDTFKAKVNAEDSDAEAINYEKRLMNLVSNVSPWKGAGLENKAFEYEKEDLVVFKEVEFRPTKEYKRGRYIVSAGGKILKKYDRMPIPIDGDKWHYTLTDFHYYFVPGRFLSDASVNDLISPQNSINAIDQALEMNRRGVGRPIVFLGTDVNLTRINKDGQSLIIAKYDGRASGGQKPEIHSGTPLPAQVLNERNIHREAAQDASGDPKHILRGQAPSSQASGIMVDILRDAAEQGHTPDIARFYRSLSRVYRKRLILAKHLYTEERMIRIRGKGNEFTVRSFRGSEIGNNTAVELELSSGISSTNAGKTQNMMTLAEKGFMGDISSPEAKNEFLKRVGVTPLPDVSNADIERAEKENHRIAEGDIEGIFWIDTENLGPDGQPLGSDDRLFDFDNDEIHYEIHRRFILSKEFSALPPELQDIMFMHAEAHMMKIQAAIAQAQAAAMGKQGAPAPPPSGGNGAAPLPPAPGAMA